MMRAPTTTRIAAPASPRAPRRPSALAAALVLAALLPLLSGCGATLTWIFYALDDGSSAPVNQPTTVIVTSIERVLDGSGAVLTRVDFVAIDPESDPATLDVFYRIPGTDFSTATLVSGTAGPDGRFVTTASGTAHFVFWDQEADLGPLPVKDVELKVGDGEPTPPFQAGSALPVVATATTLPNGPSAPLSGFIPFALLVVDGDGDACALAFTFSAEGGPFLPMSIVIGGTTVLATPSGTAHTVVWDSRRDMVVDGVANGIPRDADDVVVRVVPSDAFGEGTAATLTGLVVRNNAPPEATITSPAAGQTVGRTGALSDGRVAITLNVRDPDDATVLATLAFEARGVTQAMTIVEVDGAPVAPTSSASLAASAPLGTAHTLVWDSLADLGPTDATVTAVVRVRDATSGDQESRSGLFLVDDDLPPSIPSIEPPSFDPASGRVSVPFRLADADGVGQPALVQAYFFALRAGGAIGPVTASAAPGLGDDLASPLTTSAVGLPYTFVWDSAQDLPGAPSLGAIEDVVVVLVPIDAALPEPISLGTGAATQSTVLRIDNTVAPAAALAATFLRSPTGVVNGAPAPTNHFHGTVSLTFTLDDAADAPEARAATLTARLEVSEDGGASFRPMRITRVDGIALETALEGLVPGLSAGAPHTVSWTSDAQGVGIPLATDVRVRVRAIDTKEGAPAASGALTFDNGSFSLSTAPLPATLADQVPFDFFVAKANAASVIDLEASYATDGALFLPETEALPPGGASALRDAAAGAGRFAWSAFFDLGIASGEALFQPSLTLRLVARKRGTGERTADFANARTFVLAGDGVGVALGAGEVLSGLGAGPASPGDASGGARLRAPEGILALPDGNLVIADTAHHALRFVNRGALAVEFAGVVAAPGEIVTIAGDPSARSVALGDFARTGDGGPARQATLDWPADIAADLPGGGDAGRLYVADTRLERVRRIDLDTSRITTIAGDDDPASSQAIRRPTAIAVTRVAGVARVYAVEGGASGRVLVIDPEAGTFTVLAGGGASPVFNTPRGAPASGTLAAQAGFENAYGLAFDGAGGLLVADHDAAPSGFGGRVKRIDLGLLRVTRVAGRGSDSSIPSAPLEGTATEVRFAALSHLSVATIPGAGPVAYLPTADARIYALHLGPQAVTVFGVPLAPGDARIVAGTGAQGHGSAPAHGDGGPALAAALSLNRAAEIAPDGSLYVAATGQNRVRRVAPSASTATALVTTAVGRYGEGPEPSLVPAAAAVLLGPSGVAITPLGVSGPASIVVPDPARGDATVLRAALADGLVRGSPGVVTAVANAAAARGEADWPGGIHLVAFNGTPAPGEAYTAHFATQPGIVAAPDRLFRWAGDLTAPTRAAGGGATPPNDNPSIPNQTTSPHDARDALLLDIASIAIHPSGGLAFFADAGGHRVYRYDPVASTVERIAGRADGVPGSTIASNDHAHTAGLRAPRGVAFDALGRLYICDTGNHRVLRVDLSADPRDDHALVEVIAGTGAAGFSGDGGAPLSAAFNTPSGIAVAAPDLFYVSDTANGRVRVVDLSGTPRVETILGGARQGFFGDGGDPLAAQLFEPGALALDAAGNVYVLDRANARIRRVPAYR